MATIQAARGFDEVVTVTRVVSVSSESEWAAVDAADEHGELRRVVGTNLKRFAEPDRRLRVIGRLRPNPRWGWQVEARRVEPVLRFAAVETAVVKELERVPHVGVKRAQLLVDAYGPSELLRHIDDDPRAAFSRVGLPLRHTNEAARWWRDQRRAKRADPCLTPTLRAGRW